MSAREDFPLAFCEGGAGPRTTPEEVADAMALLFARTLVAVQGPLRPPG